MHLRVYALFGALCVLQVSCMDDEVLPLQQCSVDRTLYFMNQLLAKANEYLKAYCLAGPSSKDLNSSKFKEYVHFAFFTLFEALHIIYQYSSKLPAITSLVSSVQGSSVKMTNFSTRENIRLFIDKLQTANRRNFIKSLPSSVSLSFEPGESYHLSSQFIFSRFENLMVDYIMSHYGLNSSSLLQCFSLVDSAFLCENYLTLFHKFLSFSIAMRAVVENLKITGQSMPSAQCILKEFDSLSKICGILSFISKSLLSIDTPIAASANEGLFSVEFQTVPCLSSVLGFFEISQDSYLKLLRAGPMAELWILSSMLITISSGLSVALVHLKRVLDMREQTALAVYAGPMKRFPALAVEIISMGPSLERFAKSMSISDSPLLDKSWISHIYNLAYWPLIAPCIYQILTMHQEVVEEYSIITSNPSVIAYFCLDSFNKFIVFLDLFLNLKEVRPLAQKLSPLLPLVPLQLDGRTSMPHYCDPRSVYRSRCTFVKQISHPLVIWIYESLDRKKMSHLDDLLSRKIEISSSSANLIRKSRELDEKLFIIRRRLKDEQVAQKTLSQWFSVRKFKVLKHEIRALRNRGKKLNERCRILSSYYHNIVGVP